MGDARQMTFGIDFGLNDAIAQLNEAIGRLESITENLGQAEAGAQGMGQAAADAGKAGANSAQEMDAALEDVRENADSVGDSLRAAGTMGERAGRSAREAFGEAEEAAGSAAGKINRDFRRMGAKAENFGQAVAGSMGTALKETDSFGKSFKAGVQGAFGYAGKQVGSFGKKAKSIGNAFAHPIKTIKGKLADALISAGKAAKDLGDEAKDAGKGMKDLGDAGSDAGGAIKDAIKGALGAVVGIEAIKAGVDGLKNFAGAALEAAAAAESIGPKFDATFGDASKEAALWAENFSGAVHRSESEVKGFMASSQGMYKGLGIAGDEAAELAKITTSLGYDFGAHFKIDDSEAMAAVQDAVSGNVEALRDFGVVLDDTTLKEQARSMGIYKELDQLDEATAAQVRMNAILAQTGDIQQAAVNETDGLVNSTKGLKAIFGDFMADAGGKFTPVVEKLFGAVSERWPTIGPMLMGLVEMLSTGLEQAIPVLMDLGQTLIPVLTDTLGTLFQAGMPLISVFGSLAQTVLPPLASIFAMIGQTVLPPLVGILDTLNTSVIQPLIPPIQKIVGAILPPLGKLLQAISPLLEAISPVLGVIGDALGVVAEVLGKIIGWVADGIGKVAGFFGKLFGGAKESRDEVKELGGAMDELGAVTASPAIELGVPEAPDIPAPPQPSPVTVPVSMGQVSGVGVQAPRPEPVSIPVTVEQPEIPALGAADTKAYTASVTEANKTVTSHNAKAWDGAEEAAGASLGQIGEAAEDTCSVAAEQSESMWQRMTDAAQAGAQKIVGYFKDIGTAALGVASANIAISGPDIPHNALGTDNFEGGWTHINEEGGEMAFLPQGTAILPAEETQQLIGRAIPPPSEAEQRVTRELVKSGGGINIKIDMPVIIQGNADMTAMEKHKEEIKQLIHDIVDKALDERDEQIYKDLATQYSYS